MSRSFVDTKLGVGVVDDLLDLARFAPRAGNTQAIEFLVLEEEQVDEYWKVTFNEKRKDDFPWPNLFKAPVLILVWVDPEKYLQRYAEEDKRNSGLGDDIADWVTPYWWVDGGMAAMNILLGSEARGLGALFFGLFEHEEDVKRKFGVPKEFKSVGAIAIGMASKEQRKSASTKRTQRKPADVVHRGRWTT
ncbi:MAG: nitroreductase family protein [Actinomycetota bacterium]|nr:nitroreductase family protein [Actinomycetota bacterium]MEC8974336.1 nitroreductase family protein [Actinomycetota bacterium]